MCGCKLWAEKSFFTRDGDICKCQYRYHSDIFFTTISIYQYDIDISYPLKTAYFQFFMKYTVTHVPNDHAFITWRYRESYVRQKYVHFSIFGQDSLNRKVVNEKGTKVKYIFGQNTYVPNND